jgi:transcriptional regulator with XRE-family HTH domain
MQTNQWTPESRFGAMVLESRRALGISQKELSAGLAELGLPLDDSAISRIEKGTRSLRLSEAIIIAKALRFSLADFEESVPPRDDFERREKSVSAALSSAHDALVNAADELNGLAFVAEGHPEVLDGIKGDEPVTDSIELLDHLVRGWRSNFMHAAMATRFESEALRDAVRRLLEAVTASAVDDYVGPDDV